MGLGTLATRKSYSSGQVGDGELCTSASHVAVKKAIGLEATLWSGCLQLGFVPFHKPTEALCHLQIKA